MHPLVSVIMNCKNSGKYLREAIDSIYAQTYQKWEIIFWDNASTDDSAAIAKSYDGRLRYFKDDDNMKLGRARNLAMAQARGKYLAFLDCDDKWLPQKLEREVALLEKRDDIDFIYSNYFRMIMPDGNNLILGLKGKQAEGDVFGRFLRYYPVNMQTVMLRMSVVNSLAEKFDNTLSLSEEFDLFMRMLFRSKALYIDEPLAVYRIHSGMSSLKMLDKYPVELQYIMDKFKKMDNLFEQKYRSGIGYYKAKLGYWQARAQMEYNNMLSARLKLAPYKFTDIKFFILYLVTYLPPVVWRRLHRYKLQGMLRWVENG